MNFESLAELIEPYAEGSFDELPKGLGELVASAFSPVAHWDNLTPNRRRNLASQHDSHNDPKNKSKNEYYLDLFDAIEGTKTEITNLELLNSSTPSDARIKKEDLAALHDRLGNLNRLQTLPPFLVKDWTTLTNDALANVVEMNIQLFDILKTPQPLNCIYAAIIRDLLPESDFESTFGVEPKTAELILWIWEAAQLVEWDAETLAEFVGAELFPDKKIMFKRIEAGLPKKFAPEVGFDWLKENYIPFGDFDKWYFENKPNHASTNQVAPVVALVVLDGVENAVTTHVFSMKKAAMITQHKHEWPSIESDMRDAASNKLSDAKAGSRGWNESVAMAWAKANNKLKVTANSADSVTQAMHRMSALPTIRHTIKG